MVFSAGLVAGAALAFVLLLAARRTTATTHDDATSRLAELLAPLRGELERYDQRLTSFDRERAMQFGALSEQLHLVSAASEGLRDSTQQLASSLRAPGAGGRWGELQLRRVVELAGMAEHCDFETQVSLRADDGNGETSVIRPDMLVRLPGERSIIIDAKAPLAAYLDAANAADSHARTRLLRLHASHLRGHMDALSRKRYWDAQGSGSTPEFVVLFVPGEAFFSAALEQDPALLEDSAARGVILATPTTLIALLRTVSLGWREARMAESAREIAALGATLYERLLTLASHFTELGVALDRAVSSYNRAMGSLESRVLVSARRFRELGVGGDRAVIEPVVPIDIHTREHS